MKKMPSDVNTLILTSAFYHPDGDLRRRLRNLVDQWVEGLKPLYSDGEIREIIARENGTLLEPFVLRKVDEDMAVRMARAAFSEKGGGHRFRVVSRETIGYKGGLVITDNLKHYYAERYARGKYRRNPKAGLSFYPACAPSSSDCFLVRLQKSRAVAEVDENGFNIKISRPYDNIDDGLAARALQRNSRLLPSEKSFDQVGLRVDVSKKGIEVRTGSPESQIKIAAHMMNHDVLRLSFGGDYQEAPEAHIVLDLPEENKTDLKTVFMTSEKAWQWVGNAFFPSPIPVSTEDKLAMCKWLPPHHTWIDDIWDDLT